MIAKQQTEQRETFAGWAILEVLGHRRLGGFLQEQEIAGHGMLRIDIPAEPATITQFYAPQAVYAITPCAEDVARQIAAAMPQPVSTWDVRALLPEITETVKQEIQEEVRREHWKALEARQQVTYREPVQTDDEDDEDDAYPEPPF